MNKDTVGKSNVIGTLILLVVGVAVAGGGLYLYQDATQATENAVEADATVVSSAVDSKIQDSEQAGQRHRVYYATIQYRYSYEGSSYTSTNLCPGVGSSCEVAQSKDERSEAEDIVEDYPEDETVTAYVSPDDPGDAYLIDAGKSSANTYLILVGFGGLMGLAGLARLVGTVNDLLSG